MLEEHKTLPLFGSAPQLKIANELHKQANVKRTDLSEIVSASGLVPYFADENFVLFNTDTRELMEKLTNPFWALTVTSPPYNIGKEYEVTKTLDEYLEWSESWMRLVNQTTLDQGTFWLNVGYTPLHEKAKALPLAYLLWDKSGFHFIQEVVWHYGAGVAGRKFYSPRNEKFLWFVKDADQYTFNLDDVRDPNVKYPNQFKNGRRKVNSAGKNPTDVWNFPKVTSGRNRSSAERTPHPAQFPEAVIERVILASSNEGDVVFDPFMGSGTTSTVASRLGRLVVGTELREDYCRLAVDRYLAEKQLRESQFSF